MDSISSHIQPVSSGSLLAIAATLLTLATVYYHIKVFTYWSSRGVKGPMPVPILGTQVYYIFRTKIEVETEWRKKYGHTYGVYDGYIPALRTTDNELIKHIWIKNFQSFMDRDNRFVYGDNVRRWTFFSEGNHWSAQRALMTPMFTSSRMRNMFIIMAERVRNFGKLVESRLDLTGALSAEEKVKKSKSVVFNRDELLALMLDIISSAFFGLKLDTYKDKGSDFYKRAFAFATFDFSWFLVWIWIPQSIARYFKIDLVRFEKYEYFDKLSQRTIDARRQDSSLVKNDFIQELMNAKLPENYESIFSAEDDNEAHYNDKMNHKDLEEINRNLNKNAKFRMFSDIEIRAQMTFLFLAGFETTSNSTTFCLYELSHRPDIQLELYEELVQMTDFAKQENYDELQRAKKLDAFVSEILRLYSTVTEHTRRVTAKNGVVLPTNPPIKLPKGMVISVDGFVLQRDTDYWKEPEKFDMSRFYPENKGNIKSCSYMPFGVGPRNCAGMRFALLNIKLFIAATLLKYQIFPGPKTQKYPPEFRTHAFFLQFTQDDFLLVPREAWQKSQSSNGLANGGKNKI